MCRAYLARRHRHGRKVPPQLDFVGLLSQHVSGLPREEAPACGCYRSWTSSGSASPLMYRAHLARWHRHEGPTAAGLRRPPQPAQGLVVARSPSKQRYFATYVQPRSSRYGRAFLARWHRPEPLQAAVLRHLPQPAPGPSLWSGFPREEAPPGGAPQQLYFATYPSQPRGSRAHFPTSANV